jgi:hypothetical protein
MPRYSSGINLSPAAALYPSAPRAASGVGRAEGWASAKIPKPKSTGAVSKRHACGTQKVDLQLSC